MEMDSETLLKFLQPQIRDYATRVEIDKDLWALFAIETSDTEGNSIARELLQGVSFAHESGLSEDEQLTVYYVDSENKPVAAHWLDDLGKVTAGEIRPLSPEHRVLISELIGSDKPHRLAQQLGQLHDQGEICAGLIRTPSQVRSLLDRMHSREPLFMTALNTLLKHQLIDMLVLFQKLISEDLDLQNEIVKSSLSRDPFLQSRQDATAEIRNALIRFFVISPMDQLKNTGITNPYAAHLEVNFVDNKIRASIDGIPTTIPRDQYLNAIHSIRAKLYRGEPFENFDTQSPWITAEIAHPFRFIRERIAKREDLAPLDVLYMLERAVSV